METVKACQDCKHFEGSDYLPDCMHPNATRYKDMDYSTGVKPEYQLGAKTCRFVTGLCGVDAKWFEPQVKRKTFLTRLIALLRD
ncbi:hypothetical protein [Vibrio phage 4141]|uniref:Uncharacterized protein n=2 Tax=Chatterjeevirus TaxID=2732679 RepID=D0Q1A7_9CAUD|nr:hypothetical protein VN4_23 [Vibrio phage N4]ACR16488.1 hypothetical protein VN4_23 [Vibrio phage N4]